MTSIPNKHAPFGLHNDHDGRTPLRRWLTCHGRRLDERSSRPQQRLNPAGVEGLAHVAIHLQERAVLGSGQRADFNATTDHAQQLDVGLSKCELAPALAKGDLVSGGLSGFQGSVRC